MLNDRQLENLIRMAAEIEAMDSLASGKPALRLTGEPTAQPARGQHAWGLSWRKSAVFGSIAAAAAAIAFTFTSGLLTASNTNTTPPGPPIAKAPLENPDFWSGPTGMWPAALPWPFNGEPVDTLAEAVPASLRVPEIRGALLAILEDDAGHIQSVKWVEHDWGQSGNLADAKASDLVAMSLMMSSSDRTPRQMTVVGLRGPADELPLGDARAAELASCIVKAPAKCSSMSCCNPGASVECIPDDVSVRFERVSFR